MFASIRTYRVGKRSQPAILDVIGRGVLAPEDVGHQLAGLCLDVQRPRWEVHGGLTPRPRWASFQTRRGRGLLEIGEARDLAGGHSVACHHRGLLGQHYLEALRFELGALELSQVTLLPVWCQRPAVAKSILAPGVQGQPGWHLPVLGTRQVRERPIVVEVSVTQDQGVGLGRGDVEHLVVVGETLCGPGDRDPLLRWIELAPAWPKGTINTAALPRSDRRRAPVWPV